LADAALESVSGDVPGDLLKNRSTLYTKVAEFQGDSEYALCFFIRVADIKESLEEEWHAFRDCMDLTGRGYIGIRAKRCSRRPAQK
jgi:hypothetical protein